MSDDREKKLKELEANLAKELDQEVNLTKPSDSRLGDEVDLNPSLDSDSSMITDNSDSKDSSKEGGIDLTKIAEEAPKESSEDEATSESASPKAASESDSSSSNIESEEQDIPEVGTNFDDELMEELGSQTKWEAFASKFTDPLARFFGPILELWDRVTRFVLEFRDLADRVRNWMAPKFGSMRSWFRLTLPEFFKTQKKRIWTTVKAAWMWFLDLQTSQKISFLAIMIIFALLVYLIPNWRNVIPDIRSSEVRSSLMEMNGVEPIKGTNLVSVDIDEIDFDHVVLLDRVVANIIPTRKSSSSPTIVVEFYIVATSNASAVEIKKRSAEIRDFATRVLEGMSFDQVQNPSGREYFKSKIKSALNRVINKGYIKEIFVKNFIVNP